MAHSGFSQKTFLAFFFFGVYICNLNLIMINNILTIFRKHSNLLIYSIIVLVFITVFIAIELFFDTFLPNFRDFSRYVLKAVVFVVIYEPLHSLLEKQIRKILYNYYYQRQTRLLELDSYLSANLSFKEMTDLVTHQLTQILNVKVASLYLVLPDCLSLVSSAGSSILTTRRIQFNPSQLEQIIKRERVMDLNDLLKKCDEENRTVIEVLIHEEHRYLVPVFKRDGFNMVVVLGNFLNRHETLSHDDERVLYRALQRIGNTLENARLNGQLRKSLMERELILGVAKRFNSMLDLEKLLDTILDAIKPIVPYDAAGIFLVNYKTQEIESAVVRGYDEYILEQLKIQIGTGLVGHVAKIGKPVVVKDVNLNEHYLMMRPSTQSEIALPILDGETVIGVMNLESDQLGAYHEGNIDLLSALAGEAAIAIKNTQLNEDRLRTKELEKELEIAGRLQQSILPQSMPHIQGLDIAAVSIPCHAVGGDIYDVVKLSPDKLAFCIGDVSGKGVPGAIMMSMLYTGYRSLIHEHECTCDTVSALNRMITQRSATGTYATFFYGILDHRNMILRYTNGGHNPPLLYKKNGNYSELKKGGIVLGFLADQSYQEETIFVESGDILVLYTDGVTESFNNKDEMFGEERVRQLIRNYAQESAEQIKNQIITQVLDFVPDTERQDDITVMIIKFA